jgi:hypothetical protein
MFNWVEKQKYSIETNVDENFIKNNYVEEREKYRLIIILKLMYIKF